MVRTAGWATTFSGFLHRGCCKRPIRTSILSHLDHCSSFLYCRVCLFLPLIFSSLCFTQQPGDNLKSRCHCMVLLRTSHLSQSQSQNPNNGLPRPFVTCHVPLLFPSLARFTLLIPSTWRENSREGLFAVSHFCQACSLCLNALSTVVYMALPHPLAGFLLSVPLCNPATLPKQHSLSPFHDLFSPVTLSTT